MGNPAESNRVHSKWESPQMIGNDEMFDFDDLYSPVSFCEGGSGSSGGGPDPVDNHVGRNTAMNGRDPTQPGYETPSPGGPSASDVASTIAGGVSVAMDGVLGQSGDAPDMGAMSDGNRGVNSGGGSLPFIAVFLPT